MTDNLPALLPCPFCGGAPKTLERPDNIDGTEFVYAVSCYCDGYSARAHQLARCKTPEQAKATATSAWNRRAALAQAQSCVPAGYVLAPVEPNRAMRQAAIKEQVMHRNAGLSLDGDEPAAVIYRAMLAASPAQPVQPSDPWLPIETAPRNGTHVLLWEQWSEDPFVGWWDSGEWRASHEHVDAVGGWDGAIVIDRIECQVTHWMPLPPAPQPKD